MTTVIAALDLALRLQANRRVIRDGGTKMQSLTWRWTLAILVGTAWDALEPIIFR